MCRQEQRDRKKHQNRAEEKARQTLYRHAPKYDMPPIKFAEEFGWDIKQMARNITHHFENSCPYCNQPYKNMTYGLRDLTLDIINPNEPPYYTTNVKFCCSTCNSVKGQLDAEAFGLYLAHTAKREKYLLAKLSAQDGTLLKPQYEMPLGVSSG